MRAQVPPISENKKPIILKCQFPQRAASAVNCILHTAGKFRRTENNSFIACLKGEDLGQNAKTQNQKDRDTYSMNLWPAISAGQKENPLPKIGQGTCASDRRSRRI